MENPYQTPSPAASLADQSRRPVGVAFLSILAALMGLILLAAFCLMLADWRKSNEFAVDRRMAPALFWFMTGLTVILAFAASIGMWRGRKWGWWITCSCLTLFVVDNVGRAAMANLAGGAPSVATFFSLDSLKFVVRGVLVAAALAYWMRLRVRRYFRVESMGRIKSLMLAGLCGMGIIAIITIVLQAIFFLRTR